MVCESYKKCSLGNLGDSLSCGVMPEILTFGRQFQGTQASCLRHSRAEVSAKGDTTSIPHRNIQNPDTKLDSANGLSVNKGVGASSLLTAAYGTGDRLWLARSIGLKTTGLSRRKFRQPQQKERIS